MCVVEVGPVAAYLGIDDDCSITLDCDDVWLPIANTCLIHWLNLDNVLLSCQKRGDVLHGTVVTSHTGIVSAMTLLDYVIQCFNTSASRPAGPVTLSPTRRPAPSRECIVAGLDAVHVIPAVEELGTLADPHMLRLHSI